MEKIVPTHLQYSWPDDSEHIIGEWQKVLNVLLSHIPNNQDLHINANNYTITYNEELIKLFQRQGVFPCYYIDNRKAFYIWTRFKMPATSYFKDITYKLENGYHTLYFKAQLATIRQINGQYEICFDTSSTKLKFTLFTEDVIFVDNNNILQEGENYYYTIKEVK